MRHPCFSRAAIYAACAALPLLLAATPAPGETYALNIAQPAAPTPYSAFHLGTATAPDGHTRTVNGQSLLLDGKPILPVMGEFHYARYPAAEWRQELLKMKAGGITIVSTYVFWIHHEQIEGQWDWSGRRDLRKFVQTCQSVGMPVIVRMGPWDHGEVRDGGFPDWLLAKHLRLRSEDPAFMKEVDPLYQQIAAQLKGLLYKDGGPVIGVQVDNEFRGRPGYLLGLKKLARADGIDTPYYTRTGWPNLSGPIPFGELLPLYGAYAEGFWDRELTSMPGAYWQAFTFGPERTDSAVGTDFLGKRARTDEANAQEYPYLTCELGGGMMTSYHRRIHIDPRDAFALEIAKVGSGSNLPGFYMYHGGTNPDSLVPGVTLQETQSTQMTNYNDMPVKTYDFQAPLGEFGQIRESYHLLRRTHLFLHDWQATLAPMPASFPDTRITKTDATDLRFAVRSDGHSGFIFINNYQRGLDMPAKQNVQFRLTPFGLDSTISIPPTIVPETPITVPANTAFFLPFNMDLNGATLVSASAQPVCKVTDGKTTTVVFAEIPGIPAEFDFGADASITSTTGQGLKTDAQTKISNLHPSLAPAIELQSGDAHTQILLVDNATSLRLYRATLAGRERILLAGEQTTLTTDGDTVQLSSNNPTTFSAGIYPPAQSLDITAVDGAGGFEMKSQQKREGIFDTFSTGLATPALAVTFEQTQQAGPPREIKMGVNHAAMEPTDADFAGAEPAVYQIKLPDESAVGKGHLLLRLHYVGDVARLYLGGKLLDDNFYNGRTFDLGLTRYAPDIYKQPLVLKILPLQKGAPIYIQKEDMPDFQGKDTVGRLNSAEIVQTHTLTLSVK